MQLRLPFSYVFCAFKPTGSSPRINLTIYAVQMDRSSISPLPRLGENPMENYL